MPITIESIEAVIEDIHEHTDDGDLNLDVKVYDDENYEITNEKDDGKRICLFNGPLREGVNYIVGFRDALGITGALKYEREGGMMDSDLTRRGFHDGGDSPYEEEERPRLKSKWEGDGESFTLIVSVTDEGLETTPEEFEAYTIAFEHALAELLAEEHGYKHVGVEAYKPDRCATMVAATSARAEWEMREAIGPDVYDDLAHRADELAWDRVSETTGKEYRL